MRSIRYHKYLPLAMTYFFLNCPPFFPQGLLVTSCLAPIFYFKLLRKKRRFVLEMFFLASFPFILGNLFSGFKLLIFLPSYLLLLCCYVTVYAFADVMRDLRTLDQVMRTIIWVNFVIALFGLAIRFTGAYQLMWLDETGEVTGSTWVRFRMFTYEPSYYALLMVPLVLYSYWYFRREKSRYSIKLLVATTIPMLMAFSVGTFLAITLSLIAVHLRYGRGLGRYKWIMGPAVILLIGYIALPSTNTVKVRISNIINGHDSSTTVRTTGSLEAAFKMAEAKDIWFGVGAGNVKVYGAAFIDWRNGRLASGIADTLGEFGVAGVALRLAIEIYFFFRTKPYTDPFRLSLFICVFIIQFGGSYNGDLAEYVIWVIAFSPSAGFFSAKEQQPARTVPFEAAIPQYT